VTGTGMLWVGWFGFNAGSALGAGGSAAMALVATHVSASAAALTWMAIEWVRAGKPSALGMATGSIAGLAAVTPASGFVGPFGAFMIGLLAGLACYYASVVLKMRLGYDDSLDVFGVHGVGGFLGTVLAGVFASEVFGGLQGALPIGRQVAVQLGCALGAAVYTALVSYGLARAVDALVGLRIEELGEALARQRAVARARAGAVRAHHQLALAREPPGERFQQAPALLRRERAALAQAPVQRDARLRLVDVLAAGPARAAGGLDDLVAGNAQPASDLQRFVCHGRKEIEYRLGPQAASLLARVPDRNPCSRRRRAQRAAGERSSIALARLR
jgi:hypothetical protein